MAKKKRKSTGGGGFGSRKGKHLSSAETRNESPLGDRREVDRTRLNHQLERFFFLTLNLPGDAEERDELTQTIYNEKFDGTSYEELFTKYEVTPDPYFLALEHLNTLEEDASPEQVATIAGEALLIDPDCADAHLAIADSLLHQSTSLAEVEKAVATARRKNEALRGSVPEGLDPAEDLRGNAFLPALHRLAEMHLILHQLDEAIALFEEGLAFDPSDPLYMRPSLLAALLAKEDFDRAELVLAEMESEERSCAALYGKALLRFWQALLLHEDFTPDMQSARPFAKLRSPVFDEACALLREAVMISPWALPMLLDVRTGVMRPLEFFTLGDPFEALDFARLFSAQFVLPGLPALWIFTEFAENFEKWKLERTLRHGQETFRDMLDYFNTIDWGDFGELDDESAFQEFRELSESIRTMMLEVRPAKRRGIPGRRGRGRG